MPTIDLPHGKLRYRAAGSEDSKRPPVVFIHGFLVSNTLWSKTADALAEAGIRSYAPDPPLGSHSLPLDDSADQTPRGVVRRVLAFIEAMGLDDVTIVGNDSGGAISQFLIDTDSSRVGFYWCSPTAMPSTSSRRHRSTRSSRASRGRGRSVP